jgi:hypothetical protein
MELVSRLGRIASAAILAVLFLISPEKGFAQSVGAIVGTVTDPSGAVIPNAKITAIRIDTGVSRSTVAGSTGTYVIPNLGVGTYNVTAESQGFKSGSATGITLDVSQTRQIDFKLTLMGVASTVEVNTAPPLINTADATISGLVSEEQVQTLPLNGRNISGLVLMQPGVVQTRAQWDGWLRPRPLIIKPAQGSL